MMKEDRPLNTGEKQLVKEEENNDGHDGNTDCATTTNDVANASDNGTEENHLDDSSQSDSNTVQDSPAKRRATVIGSRIAQLSDEKFKKAKKSDEKKSTVEIEDISEEDITDQPTPSSV